MAINKLERRQKIKKRIRKVISGTSERPRMSIFRSNNDIYVQVIDDINGVTLLAGSSLKVDKKLPKIEQANLVGKAIAQKAIEKGITTIAFDRNGYLYHGRIKALAEGAREGGLIF